MAESKEISFAPWMLTIVGSIAAGAIVTVGSLLWNGNTQLTKQGAQLDNLANRITALEAVITTGTQQRYTSSDAARDRDMMTAFCTSNFKLLTDQINLDRAETLATFKNNLEARTKLEDRIRALEIWQAEFKGGHK